MALAHLTFSSARRLALFPEEARRRDVVRTLARTALGLLLFSVVDHHVPVVVEDLLSLVRYLLTPTVQHEAGVHPASWSGSCFQDLIGARAVHPDLPARLRAQLPRLRLPDATRSWVCLPARSSPCRCPSFEWRALASRSALQLAHLAVGPDLSGKAAERVAARRAAAQLAASAGLPTSELALVFGQPLRSARRVAAQPVDPALLPAIRMAATLARVCAAAPPLLLAEPPPPWG